VLIKQITDVWELTMTKISTPRRVKNISQILSKCSKKTT